MYVLKRKSIPGIDKRQVLFSKFNKRLPYYLSGFLKFNFIYETEGGEKSNSVININVGLIFV